MYRSGQLSGNYSPLWTQAQMPDWGEGEPLTPRSCHPQRMGPQRTLVSVVTNTPRCLMRTSGAFWYNPNGPRSSGPISVHDKPGSEGTLACHQRWLLNKILRGHCEFGFGSCMGTHKSSLLYDHSIGALLAAGGSVALTKL
jgi:hypothetical protein